MGFSLEDQGRVLEAVIFKLSLEEWLEGSQAHKGKKDSTNKEKYLWRLRVKNIIISGK